MFNGKLVYSIPKLEIDSNSFWREINPSPKSCSSLIKLLEVYASHENWEQVINLSSRAVLHLSKNFDRADFYHIWICALKETFDSKSLISLGKHLIKMRDFHPVFLSLALIAFHFASCHRSSRKIYLYLNKCKGVENRFAFEACGLYLASLKKSDLNKQGMMLLKKVCSEKKSSYFSWRNYLRAQSENDLLQEMTGTYNAIHEKFPFAQEPYLVASLIAIDEKDWNEAIRVLAQLIKDNPNNSNAILAMAQCYVEVEEYVKAISLLTLKSDLFLDTDYDFHYLMGSTLKKVIEKEFDAELQKIALNHLEKSYHILSRLGFSLQGINAELNSLRDLYNITSQTDMNLMNMHPENVIESENLYQERKAG
ncbi:tetratricopeptide repeat protein [Silvanigrella aquatica]|uniref:Uncharacterized protein n=1 Tax=Silvanigrella aquatica TaxID=1915309 RepID=A0A1L4CWZ0_9BACT|nr:tetratricopeptide repeat protein [Silvanigrella aquatica]APJ02473.1 hypothetical protein AXG55_00400 [Silvanigrella aquatica]